MDKRIKDIIEFVGFISDLLPLENDVNLAINYNGNLLVDKEHYDISVECRKNSVVGRSYPAANLMYIDLNLCNDKDEYQIIAHELRHIYQYEVVTNNDTELEDLKTIKLWKDNLDNYIPYKNGSSNTKYENQPLEMDASCFAETVIYALFGVHTKAILGKKLSGAWGTCYYDMFANYMPDEIEDIAKDYNFPKEKWYIN